MPGSLLRPGQCARLIQDQHQHRHQECLATDWLGCRSRMSSRMGWLHISSVACSSNRACCHFGSRRGRRRDRFSKPRRLPTPRRALGCGAMAACSVARPCRAGPKKIRFRDFWWACLGERVGDEFDVDASSLLCRHPPLNVLQLLRQVGGLRRRKA